jgi:glycerophosphoryl diester phosphodiesterase
MHCAHRGGGGEFGPENTMYSYQKCLQYGTQLLELDVKMSRDGFLVIMHDTTLERTTNGDGFLSSHSIQDLQKLDAAFHYPELRGKGIQIPTLKEFLDTFVPIPNLMFMFDFRDESVVVKTMALLDKYDLKGRYITCSAFEDVNLLLCRISQAPVTTHMKQSMRMTLSHNTPLWKYNFPCVQSIYVLILLPSTLFFWSRDLVSSLHKEGLKVLVCGTELSNLLRLKECREWGVDYIMTDSPDLLPLLS